MSFQFVPNIINLSDSTGNVSLQTTSVYGGGVSLLTSTKNFGIASAANLSVFGSDTLQLGGNIVNVSLISNLNILDNTGAKQYSLPFTQPTINQILVATDDYGTMTFVDRDAGYVTNPMSQELYGNNQAISNIASLSLHNDANPDAPVSFTLNDGVLNVSNTARVVFDHAEISASNFTAGTHDFNTVVTNQYSDEANIAILQSNIANIILLLQNLTGLHC